jgi:hypothetical protein
MENKDGVLVLNESTNNATMVEAIETGATSIVAEQSNNSSNGDDGGYPPPQKRNGNRRNWSPKRYTELPAENTYSACGDNYLNVGVTSKHETEGVTAVAAEFKRAFGFELSSIPTGTHVSVLAANGDWFYGYALNTKKSRVYFPKAHLPKRFPMPVLGHLQPIPARTLVIG